MTSPVFESERTSWQRPDGMTVIRRRVFFRDHFEYKPGQHVVFGGATTDGKTTLAFDALEYIATQEFPAYVAVSKPQDPVTARMGAALGFRRVAEWPPPPKVGEMLGGQKPRGFLIWPHFGDLNNDMANCARITHDLLMERYAHGATRKNRGGVLMMDDTMVKAKIMGLDKEMVTILAMAGAMKFGLWVFVQKPTDSGRTTLWAYEQASHLFFMTGGDKRMLIRYSEIVGGTNGPIAMRVIPTLERFQALYVDKKNGYMCIVAAS